MGRVNAEPLDKGLQSGAENGVGTGKQPQQQRNYRQRTQNTKKDLPKILWPISFLVASPHDQKREIQKGQRPIDQMRP